MSFKLTKKSNKSKARVGVIKTNHGKIKTPFFMPVATQGTVKQITASEMRKLNSQILLSNTYHLMLRPGEDLVKKAGGLHKFMNWNGPILTDSGGFQVFSLAGGKKTKTGESLVKLTENGVDFKSYVNGQKYNLTPEKSFKIQYDLGVDITVCLDECVALPAKKEYVAESVELTTKWADRTKKYYKKMSLRGASATKQSQDSHASIAMTNKMPLLCCVVQGGLDKELRLRSLNDLKDIGFDIYNIGGLSVGETAKEMYSVLDYLVPEMPENKPRYLMGVGYPENIVEGVKRGVDMFDCVIPSREGRHGRLFNFRMQNVNFRIKNFYKTSNITNSKFSKDFSPINKNSKLEELRNLSKAYLHYLFKIKEPLGARLASLNNLEFYLDMMEKIREDIKNNKI